CRSVFQGGGQTPSQRSALFECAILVATWHFVTQFHDEPISQGAKGVCDSIECRRSIMAERAIHGAPIHLSGLRYCRNVAGATHCDPNGSANAFELVTCERRVQRIIASGRSEFHTWVPTKPERSHKNLTGGSVVGLENFLLRIAVFGHRLENLDSSES